MLQIKLQSWRMPYLIDGHNLIPKVPGLSLSAADDEIQLIKQLQEFCRKSRKQVEVYFDNALPGEARTRKYGAVRAHFVSQGMTADEAISRRLVDLGRGARNWTVVSSDRAVQSSAKHAGAKMMSAKEFSRLLIQYEQEPANSGEDQINNVNDVDVDYWLEQFGSEENE